ncbi:MAG: DUF2867 domain-containing protein [Gracilibacteraceae bacterium]|nr:DUF2867 domain-containing protein [Gracilibacteraceae bacterium]
MSRAKKIVRRDPIILFRIYDFEGAPTLFTAKKTSQKYSGIPGNSIISHGFEEVDYVDSYRIMKSTPENIEKISEQIFKLPPWIIWLMKMRDVMMRPFGLKTGKDLGFEHKKPGAEFFTKIAQNENELIMGENDRHLNFRVSVLIDRLSSYVYLTTAVHYNNRMGKVYFFFIKPFHKIIVKSALRRVMSDPK